MNLEDIYHEMIDQEYEILMLQTYGILPDEHR